MRKLLIVFLILSAWKLVRTDWIVICPWVSYADSPGARSGAFDATYRPPASPFWNPPRPIERGYEYRSWESAMASWYASGQNWPTGAARIRPDWVVIGLKIGLPLMLMILPSVVRAVFRRRKIVADFVGDLVGRLVAESKRQHQSQ